MSRYHICWGRVENNISHKHVHFIQNDFYYIFGKLNVPSLNGEQLIYTHIKNTGVWVRLPYQRHVPIQLFTFWFCPFYWLVIVYSADLFASIQCWPERELCVARAKQIGENATNQHQQSHSHTLAHIQAITNVWRRWLRMCTKE